MCRVSKNSGHASMGGAALAQALFQQRLHGLKFGQIRERAQLALALSRTLDDGVKHRQRKPVAMQEHHKYRLLAAIGLGQHRFLAADGVARLKAVVACNVLLHAAARLQGIGQVFGQEALAIVLLQQVVEKVVRQLCQLRCTAPRRSAGCMPERPPLRRPMGLRTAPTM